MWLLLCADEAYAAPLAVALHSAARHASEPVNAVVVLDRVSRESRYRLRRAAGDAQVTFVDAGALITGLRGDRHVTAATYLRLFADQIMPPEATRVLFLDADTMTLADPAHLVRVDLKGRAIAAARDMVIADSDHPFSGSLTCGLRAPYFNAGVLLIDLERWRGGIGDALRDYALQRPGHGNFDQEALNDVLRDDWLEVDLVWNVQGSILLLNEHPRHEWVEVMRRRRAAILSRPAIVHFSGALKPWEARSRHPLRRAWRSELRNTGWFTRPEALRWNISLQSKSLAIEALTLVGRRARREWAG